MKRKLRPGDSVESVEVLMMVYKVVLLFGLCVFGCASAHSGWRWECNDMDLCIRIDPAFSPIKNATTYFGSIESCRLVCGPDGSLWPLPTVKFTRSMKLKAIDFGKILFRITSLSPETSQFLHRSVEIFRNNLLSECEGNCTPNREDTEELHVNIEITSSDLTLTWDTSEAYKIKSEGTTWTLSATTVFGIRHALETLSQLIAVRPFGDFKELVMPESAWVEDKPVYVHRSLLLDTARNYLSLDTIKRQIDGMAASKLNVLHWHATDSQSFPYVSTSVPQFSKYGAYSDSKTYSPEDVKELLQYAKLRGIRVIMEIDAPAHAGNGWQWGQDAGLGELAVCVNQQPWRSYCIQPPCGQLNPANAEMYRVLQALYVDIVRQFPKGEVFHMGGDEVFLACWNGSQEIIDYLKSQGKGQSKEDFMDLWGEFHNKALQKYDEIVGNTNTPILLWSSELTDPSVVEKYLDKNRYVIETWVPSTDPLPQALLEKGYKLIISTKNAWYLDHGFWGTTKYYSWRTAYSNRLVGHKNVLGGEVCMWGEYVDDNGIDSKIWPRAAAAAERLWSNPIGNTQSAEPRMVIHRERLVKRGVKADAIYPRYCYQNEGQCL